MKAQNDLIAENIIDPKKNTEEMQRYYEDLNRYIESSSGSGLLKFRTFSRYVPRQVLTEFLVRYEMFKQIVDVPGSIVECGVLNGQGLMAFAQFSAILEPVHYNRKVIGFDTFSGFPELDAKDTRTSPSVHMKEGGFGIDSFAELQEAVRLFDRNRNLGHIPKIDLVKGDVTKTLPAYLEKHPHLVVALLYLDMDIYKPTRAAIEALASRIPKGGVIAFDELNVENWPGETQAVIETLGINRLRLKRLPFDSRICYAVME